VACNPCSASATFASPSYCLTICPSVVIENFYRLFTPSINLGPFSYSEGDRANILDFRFVTRYAQQIDPSYCPNMLSCLALISTLVDRASSCGPPSWRLLGDSLVIVTYTGGAGTHGPYI
jgi:hypothetical protein